MSLLVPSLALALLVPPGTATAGELETYEAAAERIERSYLRIDELETALAVRRAAEAAEDAVPWLIVDIPEGSGVEGGDGAIEIVLSHGDTGPFATVQVPLDAPLERLSVFLDRLEDAVTERAAADERSTLDDDVDLAVELLRGASRALDRHSIVLAGDRLDAFNERIRGRLVGIGCRIGSEDGALVVREVFPDGPAEGGGLLEGDRILRVDGVSTVGMDLSDAVDRIRGEEGTPVELVIERLSPVEAIAGTGDGDEPPVEALSLEFLREEVRIPNVEWHRADSGAGHIRIDHFSQQTTTLMRRALRELLADPTTPGLVLDLRGNSGGSMLQAARTVDLFVDEGLILRTGGRDFARVRGLVREVHAYPPGDEDEGSGLAGPAEIAERARRLPIVVLVDRSSASASEIVAGALQLLDRAVLVGTSTHGKGTVQQPFVLRKATTEQGEVKLKLTIAEYHLAEDTPVREAVGLQPDLRTGRIGLSRAGLALPEAVVRGEALGLVDEERGWRTGAPPERRDDALAALADEVLAAVAPGGAETVRARTLAAAAAVVDAAREAEEARLVAAMEARGLDWSADETCAEPGTAADAVEPCPAPHVRAEVRLLGPAVAGESVPLEVRLHNDGPAPLHRAMVRLDSGWSRLPWSDRVVPLGFVPPGEDAVARVEIEVPRISSDRVDRVEVEVHAHRRPPARVDSVELTMVGRADPPLHAEVLRLPSDDPGRIPVQVTLDNVSDEDLTGVQVRLEHPADSRLEVLQRERLVPSLVAGEQTSVTLDLAWRGDGPPPDRLGLDLLVAAEVHGRILTGGLALGPDVPVSVVPPRVSATVPLRSDPGALIVPLAATDDVALDHVTVWWRGDKIAWRSAAADALAMDLSLEVVQGTHSLVVDAVDADGFVHRARWYVHGREPAPTELADGHDEDPPTP